MHFSFDLPDELVTIAHFQTQAEFLIARTLLESAGIECFSPNEDEHRFKGHGSLFSRGLALQVRRSEADEARDVLENASELPPEHDGTP